jgi:tetratricopeptide (TPR) repeat protein
MRTRAFFPIATLAITVALGAALANEAAFQQAQKAMAAKDWDSAVGLMESALAGEPDNLKYASEYRQLVLARAVALHPKEGKPDDFERSLKFFEKLTTEHVKASNAFLNYGFAYVDKMPAAGAITQVILANTALGYFSKSIELRPSWIAYYTRGNSYLFWPKIFGKAKLGVADLESAVKLQKNGSKKPYYVRAYVSLGDGYWKMEDIEKAKAVWSEGLREFPSSEALKQRLARQGEELQKVIDDALDPNKRVDTNLKELWMNP